MDQTQCCSRTARFLRMIFVIAFSAGFLSGTESTARSDDAAAAPQKTAKVNFETDVAPILREKCIDCHGPEMQLAELRLDSRQFALVDGSDRDLIKPGHSGDSLLIQRLVDEELGLIMPPFFPIFPEDKAGLPEEQIEILKRWIDEGADWPEGIVLSEEPSATQSPQVKTLFAAIRAADASSVALVLEDRFLVNTTDHYGATPLMRAALYADVQLMQVLIERGADVTAADNSGTTALMLGRPHADPDRLHVSRQHGRCAIASQGRRRHWRPRLLRRNGHHERRQAQRDGVGRTADRRRRRRAWRGRILCAAAARLGSRCRKLGND